MAEADVTASRAGQLPLSTGVRETSRRPLRIFPFDPMFDRFHNPIVSKVPYEVVTPGPAGRLVEVVDFDSTTRQWLPPLDLNSPEVLIGQGLAPSERDVRSHQQMVYAVSMRVLETFERGLGRPFAWLERLKLLPHGAQQGNAYFLTQPFCVVFGYFTAEQPDNGNLEGQRIFTALSHDVIAHELCHPVLSGLRPTDDLGDVETAAFHEGVADLIAILVRFCEPDVVARIIGTHGADLRDTPLLKIAMQFGAGLANDGWLRSYPGEPDAAAYRDVREPHQRGALLASAFLEALLGGYTANTRDMLRLNGSEPVKDYIHPDLVQRLAAEASALATRVARSVIAALDYLPPVKLTFFDVLRAVLVTDAMLFGKTNRNYRFLLIQAFHKRGLIPREPGSLATEALVLSPVTPPVNGRVPHAGDALLHAVTAGVYRRQFMVQPSRVDDARAAVAAQLALRDGAWREDIEAFANANLTRLRLDPQRTARLTGLYGSTQRDNGGNLVARAIVTLVQDGDATRARGVTLVCDSDGDIQYIVGGRAPRRKAYRPPADLTPAQQALATELAGDDAGTPARSGGLWTPPERSVDRRSWRRPLRIIPFDPMVDRAGRSVVADVVFEDTQPGPAGRLVQIIDYDPVHQCWYTPVHLDDPAVLLNSGLDVAETDPRFHQQMVYAVVMRVLETFERALGRPFRWRGERRLRVYPHAFVGQNAYFDEDLFALLFGYFSASDDDPGPNLPGQTVFTALSHDIIAHETTHAVLHRLRRHYSTPTNPDVLAFHEGFADIIAILQHFTYPEIVAKHIAATRADLTDPAMSETTPLLSLASQFGYASGRAAPLRTALMNPDKNAYRNAVEEHDRGAVLVAAVIDGFMRSYQDAIGDLLRIATAGSGVLRPGALHPDLVKRVAATACTTAERITQICIRAFDYLPPVDVTFSDYLRALVTADVDLFPDDTVHLRANLIEGCRARGIYPAGVASLADHSLRLEPVDPQDFSQLPFAMERLLDAAREFDRRRRWSRADMAADSEDGEGDSEWGRRKDRQRWAAALHNWAVTHHHQLGLSTPTEHRPITVDGFFSSQRPDADGYLQSQITVRFVQRDHEHQEDLGGLEPRGGATVVADGEGRVRYVVAKTLPTTDDERMSQLRGFAAALDTRLVSAKWAADPGRRIVERLNLRSLDS